MQLDHALTVAESTRLEGFAFDALMWQSEPLVIARQIGAAGGYSDDGGRFAKMVREKWAAEFAVTRDYRILTGEELRAFVSEWNSVPGRDPVDPRAPSLMVFTKRGALLAMSKLDGPVGIHYRAWLVDVAVPAWEGKQAAQLAEQSAIPTLADLHRIIAYEPPHLEHWKELLRERKEQAWSDRFVAIQDAITAKAAAKEKVSEQRASERSDKLAILTQRHKGLSRHVAKMRREFHSLRDWILMAKATGKTSHAIPPTVERDYWIDPEMLKN